METVTLMLKLPGCSRTSRDTGQQQGELVWICAVFAHLSPSYSCIFCLFSVFSPLFPSSFCLPLLPLPSLTFTNQRNASNPSNKDFPHYPFIVSLKRKLQNTKYHNPRKCHEAQKMPIFNSSSNTGSPKRLRVWLNEAPMHADTHMHAHTEATARGIRSHLSDWLFRVR